MAMVRTSLGRGWLTARWSRRACTPVAALAAGGCIDHNRRMGQQVNLRVHVLGVLAVAMDGRAVPAHKLASRKGRTLLKLLLARRGSVVPADVLAQAL
jgi:hypothetical protein